jgi:glyoxylase-like metal-dependent hydrolase (beta-lactamase superfamily II)
MTAPANVTDLGAGVLRVTHPLPWALDHVHCYLVRGDRGWTVIDCGLGTPGTRERWSGVVAELDPPRLERIVVTHYHPDHLGGAADLIELASPDEVVEGELDARLSREVWGETDSSAFAAFLHSYGMPAELAERSASDEVRVPVTAVEPTRPVNEGDVVVLGGEPFDVLHLPGHADGHIALLGQETNRLFGGDVILREITPNVGRWEDTAADPLGRYLDTLGRLERLAPTLAYPGHGPVIDDVGARAAEIRAHHEERLDVTEESLKDGRRTAYEVAQRIWPKSLSTHEQRFALVEAISHLERLCALGRAQELAGGAWSLP